MTRGFDFSMWHPLDHRPWNPRCFRFYGGPRRHMSLWWDFQRPRPVQVIKCRLGRHDWADWSWWDGEATVTVDAGCSHCGKSPDD